MIQFKDFCETDSIRQVSKMRDWLQDLNSFIVNHPDIHVVNVETLSSTSGVLGITGESSNGFRLWFKV